MKPTLYTISGAPRGWRALLGFAIKGVAYDIQYLQVSEREHKQAEYLKVNPRGLVPTLVIGDFKFTDSLAILAWLDKTYPTHPLLFGTTAKECAQIWSATRDATDNLRRAQNTLIAPIFFDGLREATDALKTAADDFHHELNILDARLGEKPFMMGDQPTAADAVSYPELRIAQRAAERFSGLMKELGLDTHYSAYPKLRLWMDRIQALEGFEKTMPVHWN
jgi:glutathione S-transferase